MRKKDLLIDLGLPVPDNLPGAPTRTLLSRKFLTRLANESGIKGVGRKNNKALINELGLSIPKAFSKQDLIELGKSLGISFKKRVTWKELKMGLSKANFEKKMTPAIRRKLRELRGMKEFLQKYIEVLDPSTRANYERQMEILDNLYNHQDYGRFVEIASLSKAVRTFYLENPPTTRKDPKIFLEEVRESLFKMLKRSKKPLKFRLLLTTEFTKKEEDVLISRTFYSTLHTLFRRSDIHEALEERFKELLQSITVFSPKSGLVVSGRNDIRLDISKIRPLKGGTWVSLPKDVQAKKAVINPKNFDKECFKWAIL